MSDPSHTTVAPLNTYTFLNSNTLVHHKALARRV